MPQIRNVGPLPLVHLVDPKGRIRSFKIAMGVNHRVVNMRPKRHPVTGRPMRELAPTLTEEGIVEGWAIMDDLFAKEEDEEIRTRGKELWDEYCEFARHGAHGGQDFPAEWLPREVLKRRKSGGEGDKPKFQAPKRTAKGGKASAKA